MLSRVSTLALLVLPLLASASHCTTGDLQCCKKLLHWNNRFAKALADILGIDTASGSSGLLCSTAADSCVEEPVCCINSYINGHLQIGCSSPNVTATQV